MEILFNWIIVVCYVEIGEEVVVVLIGVGFFDFC